MKKQNLNEKDLLLVAEQELVTYLLRTLIVTIQPPAPRRWSIANHGFSLCGYCTYLFLHMPFDKIASS
jgi:hypothetical protein